MKKVLSIDIKNITKQVIFKLSSMQLPKQYITGNKNEYFSFIV